MTNICHILFAFATSPLGKMHVQWHAQFWSAFSVWDWFDFFKKDACFWISVRKGKMEETHIALRAACRNIYRGLCMGMVLFSFLRLFWRSCWPYQDFCGREAELDFPESQEQVCSLLGGSKWSCSSAGVQPPVRDCPSEQSSMPLLWQRMNRRVTSTNCCVRALGLDSHSLADVCCPKGDFFGWEVANVTLFWDCWSLCRKGLTSVLREPETFNSDVQAPSPSASSDVRS